MVSHQLHVIQKCFAARNLEVLQSEFRIVLPNQKIAGLRLVITAALQFAHGPVPNSGPPGQLQRQLPGAATDFSNGSSNENAPNGRRRQASVTPNGARFCPNPWLTCVPAKNKKQKDVNPWSCKWGIWTPLRPTFWGASGC